MFSASILEKRSSLFTLIFLALSAVILSVWQAWSYYGERSNRWQLTESAAREFAQSLTDITRNYFSGISSSLYIVANSTELSDFIQLIQPSPIPLERLFRAFLTTNSNAYQIRFIDSSGYELIRLDRRDDDILVTPATQLQNKADRGYFLGGMQASIDSIYVSDFDLNVENGVIETPWRPTIRIAIPIDANADYSKDGILIVNIDGRQLLNRFALQEFNSSSMGIASDLILLNEQGHWLYGERDARLWGFMFDRPETYFSVNPDIGQRILDTDYINLYRNSNEAWIFLRNTVGSFFPGELRYDAPGKTLWYFVVQSRQGDISLHLISALTPLIIVFILFMLSLGWTRSITERNRSKDGLMKAQKMAALGGLVAGVSHELNSPLGSAITISSSLHDQATSMKEEIESGQLRKSSIVGFVEDVDHASGMILHSLNRAAELLSHFKQISVDQSANTRRVFVLDDYVKEVCDTLLHLFKNTPITLRLALEARVAVDSYPGPLSQILINLIQNAVMHGFEPGQDGEIVVSTREENKDQVVICVTDNGKGITAEVMSKLFEPFFTTKLGQGGTGLGLHLVYNIVSNVLGGEIRVESDPEAHATQFSIVIPVSAPEIIEFSETFQYNNSHTRRSAP